jgi:hypothetical protein
MKRKISILICLVIFLISHVQGQNDDTGSQKKEPDQSYTSFRLFENEDLLEITLRFDLSTYFRTKPKNEYLKANITFHLSETDSISKDIRLRTRGIFRNQFCRYPPIQLNFKKVDFGYSDLDSISKLKLVTECFSGSENAGYLLREYLIYKMFNVFTDTCFRVRLLTVNYIDSKNKRKPLKQYGFFIEPMEMLTARTNSVEVKSPALTQKNIIPNIMDRLAIFNYMIGNYDWSIPGRHNVKVIKTMVINPTGLGIAVPYDFDWTGLVNASYAIPPVKVGIESVRERIYTGICRSREVFQKDLEIFAEKKDEFYKIVNEFPYLNKNEKRDVTGYLDVFFNRLSGRPLLTDIFLNSCKNF